MKVAIIGLPQSGKSALFSAVTGQAVDPFAPVEARHAVVKVTDHRLAYLAQLYRPKKVTESTIEFVDVPGCSLDESKGREEWRRLLPEVRLAELLVVVVRDFENAAVPAYRNRIDPKADFTEMWDEMIFADLEGVTGRADRLEKALKKPTKTHEIEKRELDLLTKCREALESETPLSTVLKTDEERRLVASFAFLTEKPLLCVRNVADDQAADAEGLDLPHAGASIALSAAIEAEIAMLSPADRNAFLEDLGLDTPAGERLIKTCYRAGGFISFLTVNAEEARAWTIKRGATAVEAAAKVHTDLARGFIRAETVSFDDLVAHKDRKGAKSAGKVRKEGKTYVVADGDILQILANV